MNNWEDAASESRDARVGLPARLLATLSRLCRTRPPVEDATLRRPPVVDATLRRPPRSPLRIELAFMTMLAMDEDADAGTVLLRDEEARDDTDSPGSWTGRMAWRVISRRIKRRMATR